MRTLVPSDRPLSRRRHSEWVATYLQRRRRARQCGPGEIPPLEVGLLQFYQPLAGATRLQSLGETELPANDVIAGLAPPDMAAAGGPYQEGDAVFYYVHPFREAGGGRIYCGVGWDCYLGVYETSAAIWPAWSSAPGWVTGFLVARWINWTTVSYRYVPVATMVAGWTDDGTGWSADGEMPAGIYNAPRVAKVLWSRFDLGKPEAMPTVMSPLGGVAFDSTVGHRLARNWSDDLRRNLDRTMAYWVCPTADSGGVLSSVRGFATGTFGGNYSCYQPNFSLGDGGEVSVEDHVDGDWYLVVLRSDTLDALYKVDLVRLRDEAQFSGSSELTGTALTETDNYFAEGLEAVLVLGSSWVYNIGGYGFYDRLALWERVLTDDEILDLFNNGLGWSPG